MILPGFSSNQKFWGCVCTPAPHLLHQSLNSFTASPRCSTTSPASLHLDLRNRLSAHFPCRVLLFKETLTWSFNESPNYDFIILGNICQRHLRTRAANVWDLVQGDQSLNAHHTSTAQAFSLILTMDFSTILNHCCRFTHASFHPV